MKGLKPCCSFFPPTPCLNWAWSRYSRDLRHAVPASVHVQCDPTVIPLGQEAGSVGGGARMLIRAVEPGCSLAT